MPKSEKYKLSYKKIREPAKSDIIMMIGQNPLSVGFSFLFCHFSCFEPKFHEMLKTLNFELFSKILITLNEALITKVIQALLSFQMCVNVCECQNVNQENIERFRVCFK